jgi:hypothetical protein
MRLELEIVPALVSSGGDPRRNFMERVVATQNGSLVADRYRKKTIQSKPESGNWAIDF